MITALIIKESDFYKTNEILFCLGIIYKQQGKCGESTACFNCILCSPLTHANMWFQIGHVYEQQKDVALYTFPMHFWKRENVREDAMWGLNDNHAQLWNDFWNEWQFPTLFPLTLFSHWSINYLVPCVFLVGVDLVSVYFGVWLTVSTHLFHILTAHILTVPTHPNFLCSIWSRL